MSTTYARAVEEAERGRGPVRLSVGSEEELARLLALARARGIVAAVRERVGGEFDVVLERPDRLVRVSSELERLSAELADPEVVRELLSCAGPPEASRAGTPRELVEALAPGEPVLVVAESELEPTKCRVVVGADGVRAALCESGGSVLAGRRALAALFMDGPHRLYRMSLSRCGGG